MAARKNGVLTSGRWPFPAKPWWQPKEEQPIHLSWFLATTSTTTATTYTHLAFVVAKTWKTAVCPSLNVLR